MPTAFRCFWHRVLGGFHCHCHPPINRWLVFVFHGKSIKKWMMTVDLQDLNPLVMTNSSPCFFDGPNRNRWFTVRYKMGGPFHGYVTVYQRVYIHIYPIFKPDSDD